MKRLAAQPLQITAHFDLETFMILSGQRRIQGDQAQATQELWKRLFPYLKAYQLGENKGYVLIYLQPEAEEILHAVQADDPELGQDAPLVAQSMLMTSLLEAIPEASLGQCAPVPEPNKILKRSLADLGLEYANSGQLNVQFGLLTELPFQSDCDKCYVKASCPKQIMQEQPAS